MTQRIAVIGGAGTFGRLLCEFLLASTDCEVIICGRTLSTGQSVAQAIDPTGQRAHATVIDRLQVTASELAELKCLCIVDAAGPFQGSPLTLAEAAIEARCHYIDLADARDFVSRIAALDERARAAGVVVVTGASSTPALSNAVLDQLTAGWRSVDRIQAAIVPGGHFDLGKSVVRAVLNYAGRSVRVLRNGRWQPAPGWGLLHRRNFPGLGQRWLSLVETPDLDIFPRRSPNVRSAEFYAGVELSVMHLGLWLVSLPVRWGWLGSLTPFSGVLHRVSQLLSRFGGRDGGMRVSAQGLDTQGAPALRTWNLLARENDGPKIPALPALCVVRALLEQTLPQRGVQVCAGLVPLKVLENAFQTLHITTTTTSEQLEPLPLFARERPGFGLMPEGVQRAHSPNPAADLAGAVVVAGAQNFIGRFVARVAGFPAFDQDTYAEVSIERDGNDEIWTRCFGGEIFQSRLSQKSTRLVREQFGLISFDLDLAIDATGFQLGVAGWTIAGIRLPIWLAPRTRASASIDDRGRYQFDTLITWPFCGRIVHYKGWLEPISAPSP